MATARTSGELLELPIAPVLFGIQISGDGEIVVVYTGKGLATLLGRTLDRTPSTVGEAFCPRPDEGQALLDSLHAAARTGAPWHFTWRADHPASRELWLEGVAHPVKDDRSTTLHGYLREVPQGAPHDELREDAARFRSIVEASPVPYAINDEQQNVTYVNPAFVATYGYSRDDIPTLDEWWPRAYPDLEYRRWVVTEWSTRLERARRDGKPFESFEVRIQAKDGTQRFAIAGALSLDPVFRGIHVVVLLDITERKRAEEARLGLERQIQHAQKLESLGVLAGGIAHDFNNLLMAILGNADVALADLPETSPARTRIKAIQASARRASDVANQMLAYAGKGKFVIMQLAINELVAETSQLLAVAISKKVTLRYNFEPNLPRFEGDATQVRQVVMNLITNASEAIGDRPGTVTLTTGTMMCDRAYLDGTTIVRDGRHDANRREGEYVFVEVADDGCGMTPEVMGRIFEPFFTTKFAGRGLGLSALLGIVHGHSGAVAVDSEVGRGTAVRVLFPTSAVAEDRCTVMVPGRDAPARGCILFVDDEEVIRSAVREMLELLGFRVLLAANGREAIEVFREHEREIAAVILDLTMPILDGEQTYHELRAISSTVKVILSSGYTNVEVSRRFPRGGLAGFLKKPFDTDELELALANVLGHGHGDA